MLTLDYAQLAALLGVGAMFVATVALICFVLGCVFGNGHAEDGEKKESEAQK